jgi:hypothetical protein
LRRFDDETCDSGPRITLEPGEQGKKPARICRGAVMRFATESSESVIAALEYERTELRVVKESMRCTVPQLADALDCWDHRLTEDFESANTPLEAERCLEEATRSLRHIWVRDASSSTSKSYRSPSDVEDTPTLSGHFQDFGYERDLHPEQLEKRCFDFFPPSSRQSDHVLFSSGQAAMYAVLTYLAGTLARQEPLRVCHAGAYFETAGLLSLFGSRFEIVPWEAKSDILVAEPVWSCGNAFGEVSLHEIASIASSQKVSAVIVDSTLCGLDDDLSGLLSNIEPTIDVFRIHSGLKLFQQGLELSDVGIISHYGDPRGDHLRRIRTLHGTGLRFADVAALELPLFLDAPATRAYVSRIFAHNARVAEVIAKRPGPFEPVVPPARLRPKHGAPYCVFTLRDPRGSYEELEATLARDIQKRGLVFDRGGSFGFRGHRFEVVRPDGREPFLRVALGHRAGPSLEGILALFGELELKSGR